MRINAPVTQREHELPDGATLLSTTDAKSHMTYGNAAFVEASGFSREELRGQPHNMVRHPDMPPQAYADMWDTLKRGLSWTAVIKNRRKNGDHYWVRANATPIVRNGSLIGFMSVRTKPAREEIEAAEALYAKFRQGRQGSRRFHRGLVVRTGVLRAGGVLSDAGMHQGYGERPARGLDARYPSLRAGRLVGMEPWMWIVAVVVLLVLVPWATKGMRPKAPQPPSSMTTHPIASTGVR